MNHSHAMAQIEAKFNYDQNISHDDPKAVEKLNHKLEQLQKMQECFKAINAIVRKKISSDEKVKAITAFGVTETVALGILLPDFIGRVGIPRYALTNNNGVMKNVKDRLAKIKRVDTMEFAEKRNGVSIEVDKSENRIVVEFDFKPEKEVCEFMKKNGFRWAPSKGAWLAYINTWTLRQVKEVWKLVPQTEELADITANEMVEALSN